MPSAVAVEDDLEQDVVANESPETTCNESTNVLLEDLYVPPGKVRFPQLMSPTSSSSVRDDVSFASQKQSSSQSSKSPRSTEKCLCNISFNEFNGGGRGGFHEKIRKKLILTLS